MKSLDQLITELHKSKNPVGTLREIRSYTNQFASTESWNDKEHRAKWLALLGEAFAKADQHIEAARVWQESLRAHWDGEVVRLWISKLQQVMKLPKHLLDPFEMVCYERPLTLTAPQDQEKLKLCDQILKISSHSLPFEKQEIAMRFVCSVVPTSSLAYAKLGIFLRGRKLSRAACEAFRRALELDPNNPDYLNNMAAGLEDIEQNEKALVYINKALEISHTAIILNNASRIYNKLRRYDDAIRYADKSIEIDPLFSYAWMNKGAAYYEMNNGSDAEKCFAEALKINPKDHHALNNLATIAINKGNSSEALELYEKALVIQPDEPMLHSSIIMLKQYSSEYKEEDRFADHLRFGYSCASTITPLAKEFNIDRFKENGVLRIGFVSGDLRRHPVEDFIKSILENLSSKANLIAYQTQPVIDKSTEGLKPNFILWRHVTGMDDYSLAQQIRRDNIDILIDLSGHTKHNRLTMFAYKPALVQATWIGYFATTGLPQIDYIISDKIVLTAENEKYFVEKPARMPNSYLCFTIPDIEAPLKNNKDEFEATFGSFNNYFKFSDATLQTWAHILKKCPNEKLLIKSMKLDIDENKRKVFERFLALGVKADQIIIEGGGTRAEMLNSYNRIKLALDTFPYPGGTTTAEALWMGVPVLHKSGTTFLGSVGDSIMHAVGIPEWNMPNEQEYISRAVLVASGEYALPDRNWLRNKMINSPFMNAKKFSEDLILLLEKCWYEKATEYKSNSMPHHE